jgi:DNA-binding FadR family transcriptional regulator
LRTFGLTQPIGNEISHGSFIEHIQELLYNLQQRTYMLRGTVERAYTFHPKVAAALKARNGALAQAPISERLASVMKAWSACKSRGVRRGKILTKGGSRRIGSAGYESSRGR